MALSKLGVKTGSDANVATIEVSEDSEFRHLQRIVKESDIVKNTRLTVKRITNNVNISSEGGTESAKIITLDYTSVLTDDNFFPKAMSFSLRFSNAYIDGLSESDGTILPFVFEALVLDGGNTFVAGRNLLYSVYDNKLKIPTVNDGIDDYYPFIITDGSMYLSKVFVTEYLGVNSLRLIFADPIICENGQLKWLYDDLAYTSIYCDLFILGQSI